MVAPIFVLAFGTGRRWRTRCEQACSAEPKEDANKRLYGKELTAQQILLENAVIATPACRELVSTLNTKVAKHQK